MPRERSRYRSSSRRRSSSNTSDSSCDRRRTKSRRQRRSRSRDSETLRRRRRTRSSSRDRYTSKSKKRSASRSRIKNSKRRSRSRDCTRSISRDKHRSSKSSHKRSARRRSLSPDSHSSRSSSNSECSLPAPSKRIVDDTDSKIEKAIKAAEAAGLTLTKLPTYEFKEVIVKADMPTMQDRNLLEELNKDSFVSKAFVSSRNNKFSDHILIDLDTQTVKMPEIEIKEEESLLKLNELPSDEELKEMWIKKLYTLRKKILGEL